MKTTTTRHLHGMPPPPCYQPPRSLARMPMHHQFHQHPPQTSTLSILAMKVYAGVTIFYWYWLVLGAVGQANGWPGIPHWLPPNPTFPPSDAELQTLLDDSSHFLYLSDVLNPTTNSNNILPVVPAWRLAFFNTVEAWVIAFLPLLWKDQRRWPRPVLFLYWSIRMCLFDKCLFGTLSLDYRIHQTAAAPERNALCYCDPRKESARVWCTGGLLQCCSAVWFEYYHSRQRQHGHDRIASISRNVVVGGGTRRPIHFGVRVRLGHFFHLSTHAVGTSSE